MRQMAMCTIWICEPSCTTCMFHILQGGVQREKGASTVKWTTLDPCSGLSKSDPKLYTNFEFYEIEIHKHLENI